MNRFKKWLQDWLGITRINDKLFRSPITMFDIETTGLELQTTASTDIKPQRVIKGYVNK